MWVVYFVFEFGVWYECSDWVDDDDVYCVWVNEYFVDFESLFIVVGLWNEEIVDVDVDFFGVFCVESVFGVDEGCRIVCFLSFGDDW